MGVTRLLLRRGICLCVAPCLLGALAITYVAVSSQSCAEFPKTEKYDLGIVLGAGMDAGGRLHRSSQERVIAGVELYRAGIVAQLHFTGGKDKDGLTSAADQMARLAISKGVPNRVITRETNSLSTLQNALFSKPNLTTVGRTILITEGFHIFRSHLSFWWAGVPADGACHSTVWRIANSESSGALKFFFRENLVLWFNLGRAFAWTAAAQFGVDRRIIDKWLQ